MYSVLIVDDEPWAIIDVRKSFKWEETGFKIIYETRSPTEALEVIEREKPDVIFSDIRMPKMSGIELLERVRALGIQSKFVIVSGFADFAYAQEAIKYGVFEYCLKPVHRSRAEEILKRLAEELNREGQVSKPGEKPEEKPDLGIPEDREINRNFVSLLEYIRVNLHKKLYLKELAEMFYLNASYCSTLFNQTSAGSFSNYVNEHRMKEAKRLLRERKLTIDEIVVRTGFSDYSYFNKVFKKHYGKTPAEFRREAAAKRPDVSENGGRDD